MKQRNLLEGRGLWIICHYLIQEIKLKVLKEIGGLAKIEADQLREKWIG